MSGNHQSIAFQITKAHITATSPFEAFDPFSVNASTGLHCQAAMNITENTHTCKQAEPFAVLAAWPHFEQRRQLTGPQLGQLLALGLPPRPHVLQEKEHEIVSFGPEL
jgi:hypothetical protein